MKENVNIKVSSRILDQDGLFFSESHVYDQHDNNCHWKKYVTLNYMYEV